MKIFRTVRLARPERAEALSPYLKTWVMSPLEKVNFTKTYSWLSSCKDKKICFSTFSSGLIYSTFANGEVKEFKEVREVKAICFIAKYTTKKAIGYDF